MIELGVPSHYSEVCFNQPGIPSGLDMVAANLDLDKHPIAEYETVAEQVPIIDIAELQKNPSDPAAAPTVEAIANACQSWGFFQVVNHGISTDLIEQVWRQTHSLFALPQPERESVLRSKDNPWGYYNNELTKNQRDKKEVFDFTTEGVDSIYGQVNRWPSGRDEFKATMMTYLDACTSLSLTLLEAFCLGLNVTAKYLHDDFVSNHTGFIRLNYYPIEDPMQGSTIEYQQDADLGIHHHTDAGALTVLMQDDVGGLQVHKDGYWHNVPPVPGAMVINTGDMMQVWSNDIYQAPIHRVLAMDTTERYSIPFFFNPAASSEVKPLPGVVDDQRPAYRPVEWASFRGRRSDGDFADYGTEVQISQFRTDIDE